VTTGLVLSAVVDDRRRAVEATQRILRDLREQTLRDPLTSLYNRRFLEDYLERELIRAKRERASLALIMMDLDRFKQINDSAGHPAGDQVLVEVGALLKRHVRGSDIACRYAARSSRWCFPRRRSRARAAGARRSARPSGASRSCFAASPLRSGSRCVRPCDRRGGSPARRRSGPLRSQGSGRNQVRMFGGPIDRDGETAE